MRKCFFYMTSANRWPSTAWIPGTKVFFSSIIDIHISVCGPHEQRRGLLQICTLLFSPKSANLIFWEAQISIRMECAEGPTVVPLPPWAHHPSPSVDPGRVHFFSWTKPDTPQYLETECLSVLMNFVGKLNQLFVESHPALSLKKIPRQKVF